MVLVFNCFLCVYSVLDIIYAFNHCSVVLLLIKVLLEYCQCADDLPMLVMEVMSKTVDLLKVRLLGNCIVGSLMVMVPYFREEPGPYCGWTLGM